MLLDVAYPRPQSANPSWLGGFAPRRGATPDPETRARQSTPVRTSHEQSAASRAPQATSQEVDLDALVTRARDGERAAFSQIVLTLQEPLYGAVFRLVRHSQDTRDIVQRAFIKSWTRLPELQSVGSFRSWLFSIALNLARNHLRDRGSKRFEPVEDTPIAVEPTAYSALNEREQRLKLREALGELPERQREVVTLRIDTEMSFREIGEAVGCSEGSARVNFHHGMKRLREIVTSSTAEERS